VPQVKGWRKISHDRGFVNEITGQTLIVRKKEFGEHYQVLLFVSEENESEDSQKISPEFSTQSRAEAFAMDWMNKNPCGKQP